jgi:hypothetical protein
MALLPELVRANLTHVIMATTANQPHISDENSILLAWQYLFKVQVPPE